MTGCASPRPAAVTPAAPAPAALVGPAAATVKKLWEEPRRPEIRLPQFFDEPPTWHDWEDLAGKPSTTSVVRTIRRIPEMNAHKTSGHNTSKECITFKDPTLCRGLPSSSVLARLGRILGSSKGSSATFEMSHPVQYLNIFISHNWSMNRSSKFLALAFHFNFIRALGSTVLIACLSTMLVNMSILPIPGEVSCYSSVMCCATFIFTLLFWHDILPNSATGPIVFLDKACIHQTDLELQKQGINCISAFLNISKEMLIVYTEVYFRKLWTVYELASMLIMHPSGKIEVVPADLVKLVLLNWIVLTTGTCMAVLALEFDLGNSLGMVSNDRKFLMSLCIPAPFLFLVNVQLRQWAKRRLAAFATARSFSITAAKCTCEDDRAVVYANISSLMRDYGFVGLDAEQEEALQAFDKLARDLIPRYLEASWGRVGIPSRCALAFGLPGLAASLDLAATSSWDVHVRVLMARVLIIIALPLGFVPLWMGAVSWISGRRLALKGAREYGWLMVAWMLSALLMSCILATTGLLYYHADQSWLYTIGLVIFLGAGIVGAACVFAQRKIPQPKPVLGPGLSRRGTMHQPMPIVMESGMSTTTLQSF